MGLGVFRPLTVQGPASAAAEAPLEDRRRGVLEHRALLFAVDCACIAAASWLLLATAGAARQAPPWTSLALHIALWAVAAAVFDCYDLKVARHARASALAASAALSIAAGGHWLVQAVLPQPFDGVAATALDHVAWLVIAVGTVAVGRLAYAKALSDGRAPRRVAIVGTPQAAWGAANLIRGLRDHYVVVGLVANGSAGDDQSDGLLRLGPHAELARIVRDYTVDEIVVADDAGLGPAAMDALIGPYESGITIRHIADVLEEVSGRIPVRHLRPYWFAVLPRRPGGGRLYDAVRRGADILVAGAALIVLAPVLAAIAVAIRLDSAGPVIYRQDRAGYLGRCFTILKFRTMDTNAEHNGPQWAARGDTRRTRVGKFLRPTRLDELPQLWNVLLGEMSIIGPRPERPCFVDELGQSLPFYRVRSLVRPGITGWAQVRFPYASSAEDSREKLEYDLYYVKHRSPLLDLVIALRTVGVLLHASGR